MTGRRNATTMHLYLDHVRCYPLTALLDAGALVALRPYLRETFTETWAEIADHKVGVNFDRSKQAARYALRQIVWHDNFAPSHVVMQTPEEGRVIEHALYAKAQATGLPVVMGPSRRPTP